MKKIVIDMSILLFFFITIAIQQKCLSGSGSQVDWWIMLQFPDSISKGYAYFDSTFSTSDFEITTTNQPDSIGTPLVNTLQKINSLHMETLAWNDQLPNGSVTSVKAHSKTVLAYDCKSQNGFLIDHSYPQYPAFINNMVITSINLSQQIYGQHMFCLSLKKDQYKAYLYSVIIMRPYYYQNSLFLGEAYESYMKAYQKINSTFTYQSLSVSSDDISIIFKNGFLNSSIFQDGINNMLKSNILAQTWGRPLQIPWCSPNQCQVGNVINVSFTDAIGWKYTQDHSKWAIAQDVPTSCFGDMNRMQSQWKRGGAFYCIHSSILHTAMQKIIKVIQKC